MVAINEGFRGCYKGRRSEPGEPVMKKSEILGFCENWFLRAVEKSVLRPDTLCDMLFWSD
jgi:hypothetical protein